MAKSDRYLSDEDVQALLSDWRRLNADIMDLPLVAVRQLLKVEVNGRKRPTVLNRLYGRFSELRAPLERADLLKGVLPWQDET